MRAEFNLNRHEQLLGILAHGGFVGEYMEFCRRYWSDGNIDGARLDFNKTFALFKALDPTAKSLKKWRMIEFGRETIGGWVWTGSLVIKKYDCLEPMMEGVTEDGAESVGSNYVSLTHHASMLLPEAARPTYLQYGRPCYDGSMATMERIVADVVAMFDHMKALIRHEWANTDQSDPGHV